MESQLRQAGATAVCSQDSSSYMEMFAVRSLIRKLLSCGKVGGHSLCSCWVCLVLYWSCADCISASRWAGLQEGPRTQERKNYRVLYQSVISQNVRKSLPGFQFVYWTRQKYRSKIIKALSVPKSKWQVTLRSGTNYDRIQKRGPRKPAFRRAHVTGHWASFRL